MARVSKWGDNLWAQNCVAPFYIQYHRFFFIFTYRIHICVYLDHSDWYSAFKKNPLNESLRSVSYLCAWFISGQLIRSNRMRKERAQGNYWLIINRLIISFWNHELDSLLFSSRQRIWAFSLYESFPPSV